MKMKEAKVKNVSGVKEYPAGTDVNKPINMKTKGVKMRGAGAATKGTMARGPMA